MTRTMNYLFVLQVPDWRSLKPVGERYGQIAWSRNTQTRQTV